MTHESHMRDVFAVDPPKPAPTTPAPAREDWERPTGTCPECAAAKRIFAVFDADELSLLLDCPNECPVDPTPVAWPWADDFFARPADCKALGFEVVT